MSSWFTDTLTTLASTVQSTVDSHLDPPSLLQKLTLRSPDLQNELHDIDAVQRRKESVKDALSEILPWETRDAEMEILVDECKEVIMGLSSRIETFTGPFVLPGGLSMNNNSGGDEEDADEEMDRDLRAARDAREAEKSADKLAMLRPLPALLSDFDLDAHVGLIQRLFAVDPKLVEMHSKLSSGGEREVAFWKNYFFHCAFARYDSGLSIDEIWSNEARERSGGGTKDEKESDVVDGKEEEEEVVFDDSESVEAEQSSSAGAAATAAALAQPVKQLHTPASAAESLDIDLDNLDTSDSAGGADYEFVPEASGEDGEIDELEAEIAAALGD